MIRASDSPRILVAPIIKKANKLAPRGNLKFNGQNFFYKYITSSIYWTVLIYANRQYTRMQRFLRLIHKQGGAFTLVNFPTYIDRL
jgi:hypothetical protein